MTKEYQDFLAHHGVKGQQWGKRRYQNEDGTLTEEGRQHYGVLEREPTQEQITRDKYRQIFAKEKASGKPISARRLELERQYREKGFTEEEAKINAYRKSQAEKTMKIAAGVAVSAALVYAGAKGAQWISRGRARTIGAGASVQRVTMDPKEDLSRAAYVAVDPKDKVKYRGLFAAQRVREYHRAPYVVETQVNNNLKIAGDFAGKKAFRDLRKTDKIFRNSTPRNYNMFNKDALVDHSKQSQENIQKFYDKLKSKGYDGVIDVNDQRYSGYMAKKPAILFSMKDKMGTRKYRQMLADEIVKAGGESLGMLKKQRFIAKMKKYGLYTLFGGGGFAANKLADKSLAESKAVRNSEARVSYRNEALIREYKREHPNTELSDKRILELQLGRK